MEGAVDINQLVIKINMIINCEKTKKEKMQWWERCASRIWSGWKKPELWEK